MRILHVTPYYLPAYRYGGPIYSVHGLCKALVHTGASVTVFTTNVDGDRDLDVPVETPVLIEGVTVYYYPVQRPRGYVYSARLRQALSARLSEFDLVHIHGLYLYPTAVAARLCRRFNIPYLIAPRGMLDSYAMKASSLPGRLRKQLYLRLIENRNLEGAVALHFTAHDELRHSLYSCAPERAAIVANGLDIDRFPLRNETAVCPDCVLFLGRIHPKKGLDLLIPAFAQVVKERPTARLRLAGPDNDGYLAHVKTLIAHYQLQDHVQYDGMLLGKEKENAMQRAALFALPSYSENFGIAVIEALAYGTPVLISNRINIHRDVIKARCGIVTACEVDAIAQGILQMLRYPSEASEMGQRGRRLVEVNYTWTAVARSMLSVYEKIIATRRAQPGQ